MDEGTELSVVPLWCSFGLKVWSVSQVLVWKCGVQWILAVCEKKPTLKMHSCQPLLGVNLSPEFVNLYFPYAGRGLLLFFAGSSSILNSNRHVWQWKEEAMLCESHMHDFKSHFRWDFLAYCTRPVSVHLAIACVGCLFDNFSDFLLSLKPQQNLMKIMFPCIHFPVWPYLPQIKNK